MTSPNYTRSGKNSPCPICDRTKDADCSFNAEIVLCHSHINGGDFEGYTYRGQTDEGMWGQYFPTQEMKRPRPKHTSRYNYPLIDGSGTIQVVRTDDGHGKKSIHQRYRKGRRGQWSNSIPDKAKPLVTLYRIDDPINQGAIADNKQVFIVEGESCVDALLALNIPATTSIGGSGKWCQWGHKNYLKGLEGAKVVICPDRDETGLKHAFDIAKDFNDSQWLYAKPDSNFWEHPPKNGGLDVVDWIDELRADGLNNQAIVKRIYQAVEDKPRGAIAKDDADIETRFQDYLTHVKRISTIEDPIRKSFEAAHYARQFGISPREFDRAIAQFTTAIKPEERTVFALDEFLSLQFNGVPWVIPGIIPAGETVLLAGLPKEGKSLLAYDLGYAVAVGDKFLGEEPLTQGRVLMVMTDESSRSIQSRLIRRGFDAEHADQARIVTRFNLNQLSELENHLAEFRPTLTIIDSLKSISRGSDISENSSEYSDQIYALKELLSQYDSAGLLIHHCNKNTEAKGVARVRGSTAIVGATWGVVVMESPKRKEGEDPPLGRTLYFKPRDGGESIYSIELDPRNYHWTLESRSGYTDESLSIKKQVEHFLIENRGKFFEPAEINQLLPDLNQNSIRGALKRLVDESIATKRQSKINTNSSVYGIEAADPKCKNADPNSKKADPPKNGGADPNPDPRGQKTGHGSGVGSGGFSRINGDSSNTDPNGSPPGGESLDQPLIQKNGNADPNSKNADPLLIDNQFIDPETGEPLI